MNYEIVYDIDYAALYEIIALIEKKHKDGLEKEGSATVQAIRESSITVLNTWIKKAESKFTHSRAEYIGGFDGGLLWPFQGDPLYARVTNHWPKAIYFEKGWQPFDMKKALQTSDKVRISKDGKRYLVIPFEHGTPGTTSKRAMPQEIYNEAKRLKPSFEMGEKYEGSVRGTSSKQDLTDKYSTVSQIKKAINQEADLLRRLNPKRVERRDYKWGDKLDVDYPLERSEPKPYRIKTDDGYKDVISAPHKTNLYQGMVRFETNQNIVRDMMGASKVGLKNQTNSMLRHGLYNTFRVMSEDSQGWIHPGMEAMNLRGETYEEAKDEILQKISDAVKMDYLWFTKYEA